MDHTEAIRIKATEQYLLGEMAVPLRDEFEEHFMTCADCARDLRAGATFVGNATGVLRSEAAPKPAAASAPPALRESWIAALFRPPVMVPALAILLAVIGYETLVTIPRMQSSLSRANSPSSIPSFSLLAGSARGEASVPITAKRDQAFTLYVDVPPQPAFPMYTLDVQRRDGTFEFSLRVSADDAKKSVQILVPASRLSAGDYVLVIRGAQPQGNSPGPEIGRVRFSLQYQD